MPEMLHTTMTATVRGDAVLFLELFTFIISCDASCECSWNRKQHRPTASSYFI